ncbi:hypothetical protein Tco_0246327 [Tanacetum coccineum]
MASSLLIPDVFAWVVALVYAFGKTFGLEILLFISDTIVPTGKDNFIVSAGRPNMVPAGRTIVSPGSIILGPGG